jgi:subtilisin family serine protease
MMKRKFLLGCLAFAVCAAQAGALAAQDDRYMVEFKRGIPANLDAMVKAAGGTVQRVHPQIGYAVVKATDPNFAGRMAKRSEVEGVYANARLQLDSILESQTLRAPEHAALTADPTEASLFPCQWNLRQIDAPEAWAQGALGSLNAKVAIIDTGVDPSHVDLVGRIDEDESINLLAGTSECGAEDEDTIHDLAGHGTFMASLVTTNGINIAAVAPETQVVAIKVFSCTGQGDFPEVIQGILYAADLPDVSTISISLGGFVKRNEPGAKQVIHAVKEAVDYAFSKGKLVVSVAGNQHVDLQHVRPLVPLPTVSGETVGVFATDFKKQLTSYSNWGFPGSWIGAPGGDNEPPKKAFPGCTLPLAQQGRILGACSSFVCDGSTDTYITGRGTSISSPIVAAVGALIDGEANGALDGRRIKVILKNRADDLGEPGVDPIYGHGLVNAGRAVNH